MSNRPYGGFKYVMLVTPGGSCIQMIVQNSEGARVYSIDLRGAYSKYEKHIQNLIYFRRRYLIRKIFLKTSKISKPKIIDSTVF